MSRDIATGPIDSGDDNATSHRHSLAIACIVVAFAIWVRVPLCLESFWVDELHSAWSVWGSFGEVASRAAIGNQTPIYYWALWVWRQAFGDSELALRASSVLMSSLACGVVAAGVARQTRVLAAGAIAGMLLAIDPHSLFFGTELRVFPAILLIAACTCWVWSINRRSGSNRSGIAVLSLILLAALVQPTSIGILGWLAIWPIAMFFMRDDIKRPRQSWLLVLGLTLIALLFAWQLVGDVLLTAWKHRGQWAAFGSARDLRQIETLWRWKTLAIIPSGLAILAVVIDRFRTRKDDALRPAYAIGIADWAWPIVVVFIATTFFWTLSSTGIAPVFFRRYMIAALPSLAWGAGVAIAHFLAMIGNWTDARPMHRRTPIAISIFLITIMIISHTVNQNRQGASNILRGEGWRGAVQAVQASEHFETKTVLLSPGLIEADRFLASGDATKIQYLAFPLSGPYPVPDVELIRLSDSGRTIAAKIASGRVEFAILRTTAASANRWATRIAKSADARTPLAFRHLRFGSIQLIQFDRIPLADPSQ